VIPKNAAFVLSANQPSAIIEIVPGAACHLVSNPSQLSRSRTHDYFFPGLLQPLHTFVVDVNTDIVTTGYIRSLAFWPHQHKTIPKQFVIRDSKSLKVEEEGDQ
jgi:hypothetical protein